MKKPVILIDLWPDGHYTWKAGNNGPGGWLVNKLLIIKIWDNHKWESKAVKR